MTCARCTQAVSFALFTGKVRSRKGVLYFGDLNRLVIAFAGSADPSQRRVCLRRDRRSVGERGEAEQDVRRGKPQGQAAQQADGPARPLSVHHPGGHYAGRLPGQRFRVENFSDGLADWLISLGVAIPHGTLDTICVIIITLILSYFTLIFGELVPKRIAMKKSEQVALGISGLVTVISKLFAPIVSLLSVSTNGVLRLIGIDPNEEEEQLGEEDIRMMVDASSEHGGIDHEEKEFIQNVFEFDDLTAEEIATHRTDVDLLWMDESMDEWAETIRGTRHNRYPICEDSADNVVGILNAKEYFRLADKSRDNVMRSAVRAPYFVPETIKADALFRNMKRTGNPLAVVLDEYGGMVGIVTLNDLVEELVGDLGDDDSGLVSEDEPRIEKREDGSLLLTGNVELDDIEDALNIQLDQEEHDTLTGLVLTRWASSPTTGSRISIWRPRGCTSTSHPSGSIRWIGRRCDCCPGPSRKRRTRTIDTGINE